VTSDEHAAVSKAHSGRTARTLCVFPVLWLLGSITTGWCEGILYVAALVVMLKAGAHTQISIWHTSRMAKT
jgi:hypothetical protein